MMRLAWGISGCGSELEEELDVVGRIRGKVCELRSRDLKRGVNFRQMFWNAIAVHMKICVGF
jgi:hypothetical protein